jgi:hypothetical protein
MLKRIELTGYDPIVNDYISLIDQTKPWLTSNQKIQFKKRNKIWQS